MICNWKHQHWLILINVDIVIQKVHGFWPFLIDNIVRYIHGPGDFVFETWIFLFAFQWYMTCIYLEMWHQYNLSWRHPQVFENLPQQPLLRTLVTIAKSDKSFPLATVMNTYSSEQLAPHNYSEQKFLKFLASAKFCLMNLFYYQDK